MICVPTFLIQVEESSTANSTFLITSEMEASTDEKQLNTTFDKSNEENRSQEGRTTRARAKRGQISFNNSSNLMSSTLLGNEGMDTTQDPASLKRRSGDDPNDADVKSLKKRKRTLIMGGGSYFPEIEQS